jgi:acyl carrier protein
MRIPETEVIPSRSFADYGLDSVAAVELAKTLSDNLARPFDDTLLWNFPTIDSLIEYVVATPAEPEGTRSARVDDRRNLEEGSGDIEQEMARLESELKRRS